MATLISYLSDDFEGGETEFTRLGITLRPPIGSALLFYNYEGARCNRLAEHRANMVTRGEKLVLQRWYAYPEQPFLAAQHVREAGDGMLPYQPMIVCDWTQSHWTNVSCRWYNSPKALSPEVLRDGKPA